MVNVQTFSIWLEVENETNHQGKLHWLTKALSEIRNESVHASCQLECQALHWPVDISWMSRLRFFFNAWVEASSCRKWLLMFFCKDHFRGRMVHVWCVPWSLGGWSNLTMFQPGWFLLTIKKGFQHFSAKCQIWLLHVPWCLARCLLVWIFFAIASMYGIICLHLPPKLPKCR